MAALEISRSMLVNHGLSASPALAEAFADTGSAAPAVTDIVGSFRKIVADSLTVTDQDLVKSIVAFASPLELATFFINAKYAELGGSAGVLGSTVSAVVATAGGVGFVRTFQHGAIYWRAEVGAHEVHGPIRVRWQELGGETGFLGFPTSDVMPGNDVRAEGLFVHFQGGSIYWAPPQQRLVTIDVGLLTNLSLAAASAPAPATPSSPTVAAAVSAAITPVARLAGANGNLSVNQPQLLRGGAAPNLKSDTGLKSGTSLKADGGLVSVTTGVSAGVKAGVVGGIRDILETSAGAFEVHGAIREKFLSLGAEASILGYPTTDESGTPDGVGRFNHFQGGSIYWTPNTTAHEVHGLIRDRWASLGWERNPQLGYPIGDELIPDRRVGHRRPEVRKKPILSIPNDVIKLPADAASAGFPASVVNAPGATLKPAMAAAAMTPRTLAATQPASGLSGALGKLSNKSAAALSAASAANVAGAALLQPAATVTLNPGAIAVIPGLTTPASTPAEQRSVNRFADFENGVLFWFRGATSASTLAPLDATSDGTDLSFSGADISTAALAKIGRATFESANAQLASMTFLGTSGYSFDGAQVHNRRHRLQLILQGMETHTTGGIFGSIPIPQVVTATVQLQVEVGFDPSQRRVVLAPTDWTLTQASSGSYGSAISAALSAKLDPLLWTSFELLSLPDTDAGAPIAVLSVKTLPNGAIGVFVEPQNNSVLGNISVLANAVTPTVQLFSQPN